MQSRIESSHTPGAATPRFDAAFIEENGLMERYLDGRLPMKGARELENWCRTHPAYLQGLKLAERAQASLRLLEAAHRPVDLAEPRPPWWRSPWLGLAASLIAVASLAACWSLSGKYSRVRGELEDARVKLQQGALEQPAVDTVLRIAPDRSAELHKASIDVSRAAPQLIDLHVDMGFSKALTYRVVVDKRAQGRALILDNVSKDSNDELRMTFNTSGLSPGSYLVRIEALPSKKDAYAGPGRGGSAPAARTATAGLGNTEGWLALNVR